MICSGRTAMDETQLRILRDRLHEDACARGEKTYTDPVSGFPVFTRINHLERGSCCQSGCRHCPYGFVKEKKD